MLGRLRDRLRRPLDRAQRGATGSGAERFYEAEPAVETQPPAVGNDHGAVGGTPGVDLEHAPNTADASGEQEFEHAPDATPDEVPSAKKIGFDGKEIRERGPQSGHTPSGGAGGGF